MIKELTIENLKYRGWLETFLSGYLKQDLGEKGDVTTGLFEDSGAVVKAEIRAQEAGILAGVQEVEFLFGLIEGVEYEVFKEDGGDLKKGDVVFRLRGRADLLFRVERLALNVLQRMSGIASETANYVEIVEEFGVEVAGTRKTLWGLMDKRAVVLGGGGSHRLSLDDAVLVKDTHLKVYEYDFEKLVAALMEAGAGVRFVEVEVESVENAESLIGALKEAGWERDFRLMLDNMGPEEIDLAISKIREIEPGFKIVFEASGGIGKGNLLEYAKSGVDIVSVGGLTMSARALSLHMKVLSRL